MNIYTIGHSTHSKETFIKMIQQEEIEVLADVRAFPASRKFPWFNQTDFEEWLSKENIQYEHFPLLGGRRNKSQEIQEELNSKWNNPSFHNYADYTLTEDFRSGIKHLTTIAKKKKTAICCSERHPSRCHRLLISNWLTAQGWNLHHIIDLGKEIITPLHELGQWGAMPIIEEDGTVVYPDV